jgi:glycosyltransferase involved in cell wall biosynthesis
MLHVTLFSDAPTYGGAERYLEILATGFDRSEVAPTVVLSTAGALDACAARLSAAALPVLRLPAIPTLSEIRAFLRVFGSLAWRRPHVLHANLVDPRACNAALLAAKLAGLSCFVATEHLPHSPFDDGPVPLRHRLAMAYLRRRIVNNDFGRRALLARGLPEASIDLVDNGVPDPGSVSAALRARARAALGGPDDDATTLIGLVARLEPQKRPELFFDAAAQVAAARPSTRFVVLGDGSLRAALEARVAADPRLAGRVAFLGRRDDVMDLYPGLDLMVSTSSYEGQPFSLIEAGLREVPVVAPDIPGAQEIVVPGDTGALVPEPATPEAFAAAILPFVDAPAARRRAGALARLRMLTRFTPDAMVRATVAVYRRALGRAGR